MKSDTEESLEGQWEAWTTAEEQRMAREFMEVEVGDELHIEAMTQSEDVEFYHVDDRPGVRELRARVDPRNGDQEPLIVYVVREKYVFVVWETDAGLEPILMAWPRDEKIGEWMWLVD